MFEIDEHNLPFVRTRQALLVLDLQNDILSPHGILSSPSPPDFLDRILRVIPHFRATGNVIHIRSVFEASREVNEPHGDGENVITDSELPTGYHGSLASNRGGPATPPPEDDHDATHKDVPASVARRDSGEETFLTVKEGATPKFVLPGSTGSQFVDRVAKCINDSSDMVLQKSSYSAFKDGTLVQILRSRFVTDLYICGALTNISVFATALDAARHGYAITIVDDCVGYQSRERHDEALRQVEEATGCDTITSRDLIEDLKRKATPVPKPPIRYPRPTRPSDRNKPALDSLMANMQLRASATHNQVTPIGPQGSGAALTEASGIVTSESSNESPNFRHPPESSEAGNNPTVTRVKSKIKTRSRPANTSSKTSTLTGTLRSTTQAVNDTVTSRSSATSASSCAGGSELKGSSSPKAVASPSPAKASEEVEAARPIVHATSMTDLERAMEATTIETSSVIKYNHETAVDPDPTPICAGDTFIVHNLLEDTLAEDVFEKIRDEVVWQRMSHQGGDVPRLIAVQGEIGDDGSIPTYRHPADESPPLLPFSPTVQLVRAQAEEKLGHSLNHVLIQFYRDGTDYISEHSDKTLDIVPKTYIANVSLGAQRTMVFRTKKPRKTAADPSTEDAHPRETCRVALPHNSMCKMGLLTNEQWLHGIRQDKRLPADKKAEELAFHSGRISLTFRMIGTFLDSDQEKIWGQGATSKTKDNAGTVINGDTPEAETMIRAFGQENHSSSFDWDAHYGKGFDVLHMSKTRRLFLSGDAVQDLRVMLLLSELDVEWQEGKLPPSFKWTNGTFSQAASQATEKLPIKFMDNDVSRSTVTGDLAILLYLDTVYGSRFSKASEHARKYSRLYQCERLSQQWRGRGVSTSSEASFRKELDTWVTLVIRGSFVAGDQFSLVDCALWPILHQIRDTHLNEEASGGLRAYYERVKERGTVRKVLGNEQKD